MSVHAIVLPSILQGAGKMLWKVMPIWKLLLAIWILFLR